jgi:hypothetical protein
MSRIDYRTSRPCCRRCLMSRIGCMISRID